LLDRKQARHSRCQSGMRRGGDYPWLTSGSGPGALGCCSGGEAKANSAGCEAWLHAGALVHVRPTADGWQPANARVSLQMVMPQRPRWRFGQMTRVTRLVRLTAGRANCTAMQLAGFAQKTARRIPDAALEHRSPSNGGPCNKLPNFGFLTIPPGRAGRIGRE
jgi:hypothetical protein